MRGRCLVVIFVQAALSFLITAVAYKGSMRKSLAQDRFIFAAMPVAVRAAGAVFITRNLPVTDILQVTILSKPAVIGLIKGVPWLMDTVFFDLFGNCGRVFAQGFCSILERHIHIKTFLYVNPVI